MAISEIATGVWADPSMDDGFVRVVATEYDDESEFYMTAATFRALGWHDEGKSLIRMFEVMEGRPEGTYAIPRAVIEPDAAIDTQLALTLAEPGPSEDCVLPTCFQPAVSVERGFPLCQTHAELMADWDSLVA